MRGTAVVLLWFLAVLAGLVFVVLVVAPWLALAGFVTVPGLHFGRGEVISVADAASLTVAGSAGLLALVTVLLALQARRAVLATQRMARVAQDLLQSAHDQLGVGLQQVAV